MSAIPSWCSIMGICTKNLTKVEALLLEGELFTQVCHELKEIQKTKYQEYFQLINLTKEKENQMLEENFLCFIMNDILATKEYDPKGIATYTDTPIDVIQACVAGYHSRPSAILLQRGIELHRLVKSELYLAIIQKILLRLKLDNAFQLYKLLEQPGQVAWQQDN